MHSVTSETLKYAPQKPVLPLVPSLLCKTFFPLSALNSEADAIGRRWESFESQSAILSE